MKYFCTYGSGWDKVVKSIIESDFKELTIKFIGNGIIILETTKIFDIKQLFFFNNVYLLLKSSKCISDNYDNNVKFLTNNIKIDYTVIKNNIKNLKSRSFKIISINGNQPCKINYANISKLEKEIQNNLKIRVSKEKHDLDFVFMQRTDEMIYFLLKLSYDRTTEKKLNQGELRPEVAYLLSSLANIKESDILLDPFAGSGAIPKEIMRRYKYNMLFASELVEEKYEKLKKEFKGNNKHFYIKNFDALNMKFFEDNFIDAVITDPPWNVFEHENKDYREFYYKMLIELKRIVKPNGKIIILMGNEDEFDSALIMVNDLYLEDKLSVLINGKKAKVYKLRVKNEL